MKHAVELELIGEGEGQMAVMLQRVRLAFTPRQPLHGRVRFVLVSMVIAALVFGLVVAIYTPPKGRQWYPIHLVLASVGAAALLAYLVQLISTAIRWVLEGYDEAGRRYFYHFTILLLLVSAIAVFAVMFRYDASGPFRSIGECWYMQRDRWTGEASTKKTDCPSEAKTKYNTAALRR